MRDEIRISYNVNVVLTIKYYFKWVYLGEECSKHFINDVDGLDSDANPNIVICL